jgi:hypothetical protein
MSSFKVIPGIDCWDVTQGDKTVASCETSEDAYLIRNLLEAHHGGTISSHGAEYPPDGGRVTAVTTTEKGSSRTGRM